MIVFAAFIPQSPLLLPTVEKEQTGHQLLLQTRQALVHLSQVLYLSHADTLLLISGHPSPSSCSHIIPVADPYRIDLKTIGDFSTHPLFYPDLSVIDHVQRGLRRQGVPFTLDTHHSLDQGTAIGLLSLSVPIPTPKKIIPLSVCEAASKVHFSFGKTLADHLQAENRRIAVVAMGNLSHCLSANAPAGFHQAGAEFDASIRSILRDTSGIPLLHLSPTLIKEAVESSYASLLVLLGMLHAFPIHGEECSYECPFGVGYLSVQFHLQ